MSCESTVNIGRVGLLSAFSSCLVAAVLVVVYINAIDTKTIVEDQNRKTRNGWLSSGAIAYYIGIILTIVYLKNICEFNKNLAWILITIFVAIPMYLLRLSQEVLIHYIGFIS